MLDINKPIEFVFRDVRDWKYRHTFEDDKDVTKPYEIVGEDAVKKVDNEHPFEIRWRKCVRSLRCDFIVENSNSARRKRRRNTA